MEIFKSKIKLYVIFTTPQSAEEIGICVSVLDLRLFEPEVKLRILSLDSLLDDLNKFYNRLVLTAICREIAFREEQGAAGTEHGVIKDLNTGELSF